MARLLRPPTLIFVYEGDAYYRAADWTAFEARVRASPQSRWSPWTKRGWRRCVRGALATATGGFDTSFCRRVF